MTDQTGTEMKAELLKAWGSLSSKGQVRMLEDLEFYILLDSPGYRESRDAENEAYRVKLAKVDALKARLDKVSLDVREALKASLPAGELPNLLIDQELLIFFVFAAEYKPFYLFEEGGTALILAEKIIRSVTRRLAKMEKRKA